MILVIKTDQADAFLGLVQDKKTVQKIQWPAGRELSKDIHKKIQSLLDTQKIDWQELKGVIFYAGPGSYTGLRIGAAVANALASQLDIPIAQHGGSNWINKCLKQILANPNNRVVIPNYGGEPFVTKPKK